MPKRCESCCKDALYNVINETTPKYCTKVNRCIIDECLELPTHRYITKRFEYCDSHKPENTYSKEQLGKSKCVFDNCTSRRYYNYQGLPSLFCKDHKEEKMINVDTKKCKDPYCLRIPRYNYKNLKGLYCRIHRLKDMVDVCSDFCQDCDKYASYNYRGKKKAIYCKEHVLENMVNIKSKSCLHENCYTQPSYNFPNKTFGIYCKIHKTDEMIDILSKKCKFDGCSKQSNFGIQGQLAEYYVKHKSDSMFNVKSKICENENCKVLVCFNIIGEKLGKFCELHKSLHMINVVGSYKCKSCNLYYKRVYSNQDLCNICNNRIKNRASKELTIKKLLDGASLKYESYNKRFNNECGLKLRPDFLFNCNTFYLILEVDEHAHTSYSKQCEIKRMNDIILGLGLPVKFIRYNPDSKYKDSHTHKVLMDTLREQLEQDYCYDLSPIYLFYPEKN